MLWRQWKNNFRSKSILLFLIILVIKMKKCYGKKLSVFHAVNCKISKKKLDIDLRATFYENELEFETYDSDHHRFCHLSFILFLLYLLLNCEKFTRQNPVVTELQPLRYLLPGSTFSEMDLFSFLNSPIFSCKHSCEYMGSLLT